MPCATNIIYKDNWQITEYIKLEEIIFGKFNPLSANPEKWPIKQFVGKLPTNCLSLFDHFVKLALKGLRLRRVASVHFGYSDWELNNSFCQI